MGYELANAAANLGAEVILILGPSSLTIDNAAITLVKVVSGDEMHEQSHIYYGNSDIVICAAAVADYRPKNIADQKIKKTRIIL